MALAIVVDNTKKKIDLFEKDVWKFEELGVETPITKSDYQLNFSRIEQHWLKITAKKFINLMPKTSPVLLVFFRSSIPGLKMVNLLKCKFLTASSSSPFILE